MKHRPDPRDIWRELCASLHEEDGLTPAELNKKDNDKTTADRATQRLCAQAGRAIRMALLADCHDQDLQSLEVTRVEPWPDAKRLRVHLAVRDASVPLDQAALKLHHVGHLLRDAVAQSITRKRAPQLRFVVTPHAIDRRADDDR